MRYSNSLKNISFVAAAICLSLALCLAAVAWVEPNFTPPAGNIAAPLNTSANPQTKAGDMKIGDGLWITSDSGEFALRGDMDKKIKFKVSPQGEVYADWKIDAPQVCINNDCRSEWVAGRCPAGQYMTGIENGSIKCDN